MKKFILEQYLEAFNFIKRFIKRRLLRRCFSVDITSFFYRHLRRLFSTEAKESDEFENGGSSDGDSKSWYDESQV